MGEDHLQGKTEFGEDSSKVGASKSNDFVTGPRHPFPPPATMRRSPLPSSQASHPLLFGLQGSAVTLRGEGGGGTWGPNWGSEGGCGDRAQPPLGSWQIISASFPSGHTQSRGKGSRTLGIGFPAWGAGGHVISTLIWQNPQILSPNCQLPTPMGSKCNPVGPRYDGLLGPHPTLSQEEGERCPQLGVPAAPEQWGQASRCRSVLGGWCSRPTRGSRLGLGLHVLDTGQDFLLVSRQSDSNSEQVLSGDLADQFEGAKASGCETFFVSSHLDGSKPLTHRAKS